MVDLRATLPALHLSSKPSEEFESEVTRIETQLMVDLEDIDVAISQDVMLLDTYMPHNIAVRRVAMQRPDLLWLHWIHSTPMQNPPMEYPYLCRGVIPPGHIVYPNQTDLPLVQRAYKMAGQEHRVVYSGAAHTFDVLRMKNWLPETRQIVKATDFLDAEIGIVYPARMGVGKAAHKIIYLMGGLKDQGMTSCFIGVDWQSQGDEFMTYKEYCHTLAKELGIDDKVFFTSEIAPEFEQQVSHDVVMELLEMSVLYIHPSRTETSSLTTREAILAKNALALNVDSPPMQELYTGKTEFFDFGGIGHERTYQPTERAFWSQESRRLVSTLKFKNQNIWSYIQAKKEWGPKVEWQYFEKLLYLEPKAGFAHAWRADTECRR